MVSDDETKALQQLMTILEPFLLLTQMGSLLFFGEIDYEKLIAF